MNRPDKAGEPSMEEILASIRQIIADEPSAPGGLPPVAANPLVPQSASDAGKAGTQTAEGGSVGTPPLFDRLSGELKKGTLPPTSPFGSKRPLSFQPDQDLADMFDEPNSGAGSEPAPKPGARVEPDPGLGSAPAASASVSTNDVKPALDGAQALPPQFAVSSPSVPPPPFGRPATSGAETPAPRTFGFPPMRKASFYPPEAKPPVLPPIGGAAPEAKPDAVSSSLPTQANGGSVEDALKRLSGFGSLVPGELAAGAAAPAASPFGVPAQAPSSAAPHADATRAPDLSLSVDPLARPGAASVASSVVAPKPGPSPAVTDRIVFPELSSAGARGPEVPKTTSLAETAQAAGATATSVAFSVPSSEKPAEPLIPVHPFSATASAVRADEPRLGGVAPDPAQVALGALAQGLAASAAASSSGSTPAAVLAPVALTAVDETMAAPLAASGGVPPQASLPAAAPRTLEDTVADMLRPMLQQWVSDNMPRIMERALKAELSKSLKTDPNSSGS